MEPVVADVAANPIDQRNPNVPEALQPGNAPVFIRFLREARAYNGEDDLQARRRWVGLVLAAGQMRANRRRAHNEEEEDEAPPRQRERR